MALILAGCIGTTRPTTLVENITCPSEPPPELPSLPERPEDMRDLHPERIIIEGLWAGAQERQETYRNEHSNCP